MSDPNAKIDPVAMQAVATHVQCTAIRAAAYGKLFGTKPFAVYAFHQLRGKGEGPFLIDVFCYPLAVQGRDKAVLALVTNGMSDQAMAPDQQRPGRPRRRELIQLYAGMSGLVCATTSRYGLAAFVRWIFAGRPRHGRLGPSREK